MVSAAIVRNALRLAVFPFMEPTLRTVATLTVWGGSCFENHQVSPLWHSIRSDPDAQGSGHTRSYLLPGCYQPSASWRKVITLGHESLQAVAVGLGNRGCPIVDENRRSS